MFKDSRRDFLKKSAVLIGSYPLLGYATDTPSLAASSRDEPVKLTWITKPQSGVFAGATCGVCWAKGKVNKQSAFVAADSKDLSFPVQSWPLAYWPDGSLKWSAHAFDSQIATAENIFIKPAKAPSPEKGITVSEATDEIVVDTGVIRCVVSKSGETFIRSIFRKEKEIVKDGKLVVLLQDQPDAETAQVIKRETFAGKITDIKVEQDGPIRAVIKVTGTHTSGNRQLIQFVLRLYFYRNSEAIRLLHTSIYDADENHDFIKGLGLTFSVPLNDEFYNRHIRFVNSEHDGIFSEAVKGLTGLRRDPGKQVREKQINGKAVSSRELPEQVSKRLQYIPAFGDYTLFQGDAGSFTIRKRTSSQHSWIASTQGHRAAGMIYLGTPSGGLAAGIRNFWQSYPAQLDVRNATEETGTVNLWLWAPDAPAMDLRFYHDGMGQDTYEKQREGLEITYEDYEPGFGTPHGVARTSELMLWAMESTPSGEALQQMARAAQDPAVIVCDTKHLEKQKAFGGNWCTADRSVPEKAAIEDQLDQYFDYYKKQVDERNWYGFWNYGDFMHSYDRDRHTWRYDVGGFAWDNSELSTDLWLWYYFLHTGRADVFRVAEAMTRHTGEVDVYHLGRFAPLGSRHNVMHWGCSAKQLRISTATNRRIYYYLTADERVGDLLDEQVDAAKKLKDIVPGRKLPDRDGLPVNSTPGELVPASFGTDWGSIAAAWLTRWERTGDTAIRKKLINSMATIAKQPHGFFTGSGWLDLSTGKFAITNDKAIHVSHLNAVFGLVEICEELISLVDEPGFTQAWLQYCRMYNATSEEQQKELGQSLSRLNLQQGHSRLTAFAASYLNDGNLAKRAWTEFYGARAGITPGRSNVNLIEGTEVLYPVDEDSSVSTNAVAQWGLAAMQCLTYVGKYISK